MKKTRTILAAATIAGFALVTAAVPALASAHAPFAVQDVGGVVVTRHPVAVHQVVHSGGVAYTVTMARPAGGVYVIRLSPQLPASDAGKTVTFTT